MNNNHTTDPFPEHSHQEVLDGLAQKVDRLDELIPAGVETNPDYEIILKARANMRRHYLRARGVLTEIAASDIDPAKAREARWDMNNALIEFEELTNAIAMHHEKAA